MAVQALVAIGILASLIWVGYVLIRMNRHAVEVFSYLRLHHTDIWVRLGSPATLKTYVAGTRDPSGTFIMRREYERLGSPTLNNLCDALRREQIVLQLVSATVVLALIAGVFVAA